MAESIRAASESVSPAQELADLWHQHQAPDLSQFLARFPELSPPERLAVLRVDQGERWRHGERIPVESYLAWLPDLKADSDQLVDLIYSEIVLRESLGESPGLEEYRTRFPQFAAPLDRQFALDRAMNWDSLLGQGNVHSSESETLPEGSSSRRAGKPDTEPVTAPESAPTGPSQVIVPGYTILEELGRGGMGVVYKARQEKLQRIVALKMILAGAQAGPDVLDRLRREAEAVARLQHANIVQIYEIGEHDGLPFLSLELIDGGSLDRQTQGMPLPADQAADLVAVLAQAIHYAHERGIVHRDLKPANVLLQIADCRLQIEEESAICNLQSAIPKITDFGLAKRLDLEPGPTQSGAIVGTPSYMAPEQAQGRTREIGPAADIYALGAILYELLTGRPPFKAASSLDTVLQVIGEEPVAVRRLQPKVPRDLETICLKCLEKEPRKRYFTAAELADDLRRFQNGEPIRSRPISAGGRLIKAVKRRPALSALVLALVLAPAVAFAGVFWHLRQAREDEQQTRAALDRAEYSLYLNHIALASQEWRAGNVDRAEQLLDRCPRELRRWEWHYLKRLCHLELQALPDVGGFGVAFSPDGLRLASASAYNQTVQVLDLRTGKPLLSFPKAGPGVAFNKDGSRLASGTLELGPQGNVLVDHPSAVKVWDMTTGREVLSLGGPQGHRSAVWAVAFSRDGKRLASASWDRTVKIWDAHTGQLLLTFRGHQDRVESVAFSPNDRRLASVSADGVVLLWNSQNGQVVRRMDAAAPTAARAGSGFRAGPGEKGESLPRNEKGEKLPRNEKGESFSRSESSRPPPWDIARKVWDATCSTEVLTLRGQTHHVHAVAFSPDGRLLALTSGDAIKIWDVRNEGNERPLLTLRGHTDTVRAVAFSPDSKRLASAGYDKAVKVWDVERGEELFTLHGHTAPVNGLAYSFDGQRLASAGWDRQVLIWDATSSREMRARARPTRSVLIRSVAFHPDGRRGAAGRADGTIQIWDAQNQGSPAILAGHDGLVRNVAFSADGKFLVSAGYDQTVKVWDVEHRLVLLNFRKHKGRVFAAVFSPDGRRIASAGQDGTVLVWERASGKVLVTFRGHKGRVHALAVSPDGRLIASAGDDLMVRVWEAASGREVLARPGHMRDIMYVTFSPNGRLLASAGLDQVIKVWESATGRELHTLEGHTEAVVGLAFSPDSRRLASASLDRTVKLWDPSAGLEILALRGAMLEVFSVAFSPDGNRLASGGADGMVLLWES